MEMRKFLILFPALFAVVALLVSCASHERPAYTWPSLFNKGHPINTTMIEVTGDQGEKLRVKYDLSGKCEKVWIYGEEKNCEKADLHS